MISNHDFTHNGLTLRSTIHVPDGPADTAWPTAVFVHGFSSNRIEVVSFVGMSRLLQRNGIASVRFDLSGHGESDGDFFDVTITNEIAETRAVVQAVRTFDFADPARISLVGMSMGGVVAGIVAAEEPGIRAACLWSPAAVAPFEIGSGYLKGRDIAAQIRDKGYFDADGHRMSPASSRTSPTSTSTDAPAPTTALSASSTVTETTSPHSSTRVATSTTIPATPNSRWSKAPTTPGRPCRTAPTSISPRCNSSEPRTSRTARRGTLSASAGDTRNCRGCTRCAATRIPGSSRSRQVGWGWPTTCWQAATI
jgi:pimeloyl-ACP methyl ester carboxylesterase